MSLAGGRGAIGFAGGEAKNGGGDALGSPLGVGAGMCCSQRKSCQDLVRTTFVFYWLKIETIVQLVFEETVVKSRDWLK